MTTGRQERLFLTATPPRDDTLARRAYQSIRLAIMHGELQPGRLYSESLLAQLLEVSRTPAREALRQLAAEGLVEIEPQRGFRLRSISRSEQIEFFCLRDLLEGYVVRTISARVSPEELAPLEAIVEQQRCVMDDQVEFINLDEQFHLAMAHIAGLTRTAQIIATLRGALWLLGAEAAYRPERRDAVITEHAAVVEAVKQRDADRAASLMRHHLLETAHVLGINVSDCLGMEDGLASSGPGSAGS